MWMQEVVTESWRKLSKEELLVLTLYKICIIIIIIIIIIYLQGLGRKIDFELQLHLLISLPKSLGRYKPISIYFGRKSGFILSQCCFQYFCIIDVLLW
jgi:ABC-type antimicrobial peptide transport system permease subunit